jgi:hypothetical protein
MIALARLEAQTESQKSNKPCAKSEKLPAVNCVSKHIANGRAVLENLLKVKG